MEEIHGEGICYSSIVALRRDQTPAMILNMNESEDGFSAGEHDLVRVTNQDRATVGQAEFDRLERLLAEDRL